MENIRLISYVEVVYTKKGGPAPDALISDVSGAGGVNAGRSCRDSEKGGLRATLHKQDAKQEGTPGTSLTRSEGCEHAGGSAPCLLPAPLPTP